MRGRAGGLTLVLWWALATPLTRPLGHQQPISRSGGIAHWGSKEFLVEEVRLLCLYPRQANLCRHRRRRPPVALEQGVRVLLNLDKPLKKATLHNEFCSLVPKPHGTRLKPVGSMGRDGGWFEVRSESEAAVVARSNLLGALVTRCPRC